MASPTATSTGSPTQPTKADTETELKQLAKSQFEAIYREYRPTLVRFAELRKADDPEAAADHALFEYHRAWHRLDNRDDRALRSYLLKATATQVIDQHRRRTKSVETEQLLDDLNEGEAPGFEDATVDAALLQQLIAELPPAQRDTILQRFYLDLTAEDVGRLQGRQANTVYQLQHRAIANLRKALLATMAVALVALVVWLTRGTDPTQPVSTDPVGGEQNSIENPEPTPGGDAIERVEQGRADGAPDRAVSDAGADGIPAAEAAAQTTPADQDPERPRSASAIGGSEDAESPTDPGPVGAVDSPAAKPTATPTTSPTTQPPPTPTTDADPDPATTQVVPSTTVVLPPTTAPPAVMATQGFNRCSVFAVGSDRIVIVLFDPSGEIGQPDDYRSPSSIRLVTASGGTVFEMETDGQGVNGDTSGSAGWLEFDNGVRTHRRYADASPPAEWGLLVDHTVPDDWNRVEYINAQGSWTAAPTCNI